MACPLFVFLACGFGGRQGGETAAREKRVKGEKRVKAVAAGGGKRRIVFWFFCKPYYKKEG